VLFLIGLFPPGRVAPLLLLAAMVVAPPAKADERTAYGAYRTGDYVRAQADYAAASGYAARMGEGASAYRRANFAHALAQFRFAALIAPDASSRADALYNLGNAALRAGDPPLAVEAYRGALALRDEARTRHNLALAQARLATFLAGQEQGIRPGRHVAEVGQGWDPEQSDFPPDEESVASTYRRGDASAAAATPSDHSPWQTTERDYRAGLKKLELLEDQTAEVLRGLAAGERSP
jgi:Ca-activated chloride channel family protein